MDHDVAVGTSPVLQHARLLINSSVTARRYCQELTGMKIVGVAALAKHRLFHDQQRLVRGAVRIVAIEAAFPHRRMLVEEGSALFCMALVTLVIDGVGGDQPLGLSAMRIVAVGADHLSLTERMMRRFHQGCPDLLMAARAKLQLCGLGQQLLVAAMNLVAINTSQLGFVVLTPVPQSNVASGVARQADGISLGGRQGLCKVHETAYAVATASRHVIGSRAVAAFTSLVPRWRITVGTHAHAIVFVTDELVVMAARTQLCSNIGGGWGGWGALGGRGCRNRSLGGRGGSRRRLRLLSTRARNGPCCCPWGGWVFGLGVIWPTASHQRKCQYKNSRGTQPCQQIFAIQERPLPRKALKKDPHV